MASADAEQVARHDRIVSSFARRAALSHARHAQIARRVILSQALRLCRRAKHL
jgi:hypothetical protein